MQWLSIHDIKGSQAKLTLYEAGQKVRTFDVFLGKNGIGKTKEGDAKTPVGTFALRHLYSKHPIKSAMPHTLVTPTLHCVDDSMSLYYNRIIDSADIKMDYRSYEQMNRDDGLYDYLITIDYNSENLPNKGSCIFMHVGDKPTAGCIALPKETMQWLVMRLDPSKQPTITIGAYK